MGCDDDADGGYGSGGGDDEILKIYACYKEGRLKGRAWVKKESDRGREWSKQQDPHSSSKTVEKEVLPLHYACSRVSDYRNVMISGFESDKSEGQTRVNPIF